MRRLCTIITFRQKNHHHHHHTKVTKGLQYPIMPCTAAWPPAGRAPCISRHYTQQP